MPSASFQAQLKPGFVVTRIRVLDVPLSTCHRDFTRDGRAVSVRACRFISFPGKEVEPLVESVRSLF